MIFLGKNMDVRRLKWDHIQDVYFQIILNLMWDYGFDLVYSLW